MFWRSSNTASLWVSWDTISIQWLTPNIIIPSIPVSTFHVLSNMAEIKCSPPKTMSKSWTSPCFGRPEIGCAKGLQPFPAENSASGNGTGASSTSHLAGILVCSKPSPGFLKGALTANGLTLGIQCLNEREGKQNTIKFYELSDFKRVFS